MEAMEASNRLETSPAFICKGFLLSVSIFVGFFGVFFSLWKDIDYAVPSFLFLECTSAILLNMYVQHKKGTLFTKYNRQRLMCVLVFACIIWVSTFGYSAFLIFWGIKNKEDFSVEKDGSFIALIPCFVACLWSGLLIYETRRFIGMFDEQYGGSSLPYRLN
ncbi:uncharacterized protein LOC129972938 [Argiope bruennichi]|uniref:Uncharacterized protein n=1 Tax=Argiope bruennichi TaxID=94029 RepID=A0A8T0F7M0_ARGBR|nr:uncharacterized protein LOC129972938 [Argiope bruennichi]XP_055943236.1 uncharacterized protein LOC129972938 [Argiope bruennichi]KAF8786328.1 hypothetical protein HNY73_008057 [Argiope bruennichi]